MMHVAGWQYSKLCFESKTASSNAPGAHLLHQQALEPGAIDCELPGGAAITAAAPALSFMIRLMTTSKQSHALRAQGYGKHRVHGESAVIILAWSAPQRKQQAGTRKQLRGRLPAARRLLCCAAESGRARSLVAHAALCKR